MSVAAYTVELDPVVPGIVLERTPLPLHGGVIDIQQDGVNWGESTLEAYLTTQRYGGSMTDWRVPNRVITIPLTIGASNCTEAEEEEARQKLQEKVGLIQRLGGILKRQRENGQPLYCDIVTAKLTIPDKFGEGGAVEPEATLTLECLPDFWGEEVNLAAVSATGNLSTVLRSTTSAPAPEVPVVETFKRANEDPLAREWSLVTSAANKGEIHSERWETIEPETESGAYYTHANLSEPAAYVEVSSTSNENGQWFGVWACLSSSAKSGYRVKAEATTEVEHKNTVTIEKWVTGTLTTLKTLTSIVLEPGDYLGIVVKSGTVYAWRHHGSGWVLLGSETSATYTSGYCGIASYSKEGFQPYLNNFAVGVSGQAVIAGDYPARTRIRFTDTSGNNQRGAFWGLRSTYYSSEETAALWYDAKELTKINGAEEVSESGTYSGHAIKLLEPATEAWHPFLETTLASGSKQLTHLGSYRVWARVKAAEAGMKVRFTWGNDDATAPLYNEGAEVPEKEAWELLDLGEMRLEEPPVGEHWWKGTLQAYTGSTTHAVLADRLWFQPVDDGAGRLRATAVPASGSLQPSKEPETGESNNSLHSGKAWTNPTHIEKGHSGEHAEVELVNAEESRALVAKKFGFKLFSGATVRGIAVSVPITVVYGGITLVARLMQGGALVGETQEHRAGSGEAPTFTFGGASSLWGTTWTAAQAEAEGFGVALWVIDRLAQEAIVQVRTPVAVTVCYSTVSATPDAVVYSDRRSYATWEGTYREDSGSEAYADVSEQTGDLPRLPPSGLENRPVQLLVKNSRGLLPAANPPTQEADSAIDALEVVTSYRPCYIGRI